MNADLHAINLMGVAALALDRTKAGGLTWERTQSGAFRRVGAMTQLTIAKADVEGDGYEFLLQNTADPPQTWGRLTSQDPIFGELWEAAGGD